MENSIAQRQMKQGLHLTVTLQGKVIYMLSRAATNIWGKAVISDGTDVYNANNDIFFSFSSSFISIIIFFIELDKWHKSANPSIMNNSHIK